MRTAQRLLFSLLLTALGGCGRDNPNFGGPSGQGEASTALRFEPSSFRLYLGQGFGFDVTKRGVSVLSALDSLSAEPTGIVTFLEPGIGLTTKAGETELIARNDGEEARATVTVLPGELEEISVEPNPIRLRMGETVQLRVTGFLTDGSALDLTPIVLGTTYESDLLSVDSVGVATAIAVGQGRLTVRHGAFITRADVVVEPDANPLTKLEIVPAFVTLPAGESLALQVVGTLEDGTQIDLTRGELGTTYRSSATGVASVTGNGRLRAVAPGFAEITATNSGLTAVAVVEVPGFDEVVSIEIRPRDFQMQVGEQRNFQVLGRLASGATVDLTGAPELVLAVVDTRVAAVQGARTLIARGVGETLFSASFRGRTDQVRVRVDGDSPVIELRIEPSFISLRPGEFARYSVIAVFQNGQIRDVTFDPATAQFTFDGNIAFVTNPGELLAVQSGVTVLQASYGNLQASARVLVEDIMNPYVAISIIAPAVMFVGEGQSFFVLGVRADGSFDDITFDPNLGLQNNRPNVLSVQPGNIQALSAGVATITATYFGLVANAQVRVQNMMDPIVSLTWNPPSLTLQVGQSAPAQLIAGFASGATANVTLDPSLQGSLSGPIDVSPGNGELIVTALGPGRGELVATYQGLTAVLEVLIDVQVVDLILNFPANVAVGETAPYSVLAQLSDGRLIDVTFDPALQALVNPQGRINLGQGQLTGLAPGVVVIDLFYQGVSRSVRVRVLPANLTIVRIEFRPSSINLSPGQTQIVDIVAIRTDGTEFSIANDPNLILGFGPAVVAFPVPGGLQVSLQGNVMQTFLDATFQNFQARLVITTGPMPVLIGIRAEPNPIVLNIGATLRINVIGLYSDGSEAPLTTGLSFTSSDPQVASVNGATVTGQSAGRAEIRVVAGPAGFTDIIGVNVTSAQLVGLRAEPSAITLAVGDSITISVFGVFSDGSEVLLTSGLTFQSFNPNIASVDPQGTVTGLQTGIAFITILGPNGLNQSVLVSVVSGSIPRLFSVTPNAITVGSPDTIINVTGQNFLQGDQIVVGFTPIQTLILGPTQLQAIIPSNLLSSAGTIEIRLVRLSSGAFSNALPILVGAPPRLLNFSPTQITQGGTIQVQINGSGLTQLTFSSTRLQVSGSSEDPSGTSASVTLTAAPNLSLGPAEVRISNPFGSVVMIIDVIGGMGANLTVNAGQTVTLSGVNNFGDVTVETGGRIVAGGNTSLAIIASGNITVRGRIEANGQDGAPGFQNAARGGNAGGGGGGGGGGGDGDSPGGAPGGVGAPNGQASAPGQGSGTPAGNGGGTGAGRGARFQCGAAGGGGGLGGGGGAGGGEMGPGTGGAGGFANGAGSDEGGGTGGGGGTTCGNNSGGGGGGGGGVIFLQAGPGGTILIDGMVEARGGRGGDGFQGTGGGGGGSGGLVVLVADTGAVIVNDTVRVRGGAGGNSDFASTGGGGGGGFIVLVAPMVNTAGGQFELDGAPAGSSLGGGTSGLPGGLGQLLINP